MKKVQWDMNESFVFPVSAGMPIGAEKVNVTPIFTINRTDDAVRLSGIYHIAANIALNEEKSRGEIIENAISIDDVEVEGKTGYFEYAVPFNIDLPAAANDPLDVTAANVLCNVDGQGLFAVTWDVECSYLENVVEKEEISDKIVEEKELVKEKIVMEEEKSAAKEEKVAVKEEEVAVKEEKVAVKEEKMPAKEAKKNERQIAVEAEVEVEVEVAKAKEVEAPTTAVAIVENTSFSEADEVLSFIEGLDDGISASSFRLNDVLVQNET